MIDGAYVERMARCTRWQNQNLYSAAGRLSETEWRPERGAFWGSPHKTLNHLVWGDQISASRLTASPRRPVAMADSGSLYPDCAALKHAHPGRRAILRYRSAVHAGVNRDVRYNAA
jgi:hypothetical protein